MKNVEAAKKLLLKAIELDDEELIAMANELLEAGTETKDETPPETKKPKASMSAKLKDNDTSDFIFTRSSDNKNTSNAVAVNEVKNRVNLFTDDGTEAKDVTTPKVELTERRRPPFKMIKQTCKKCSETFETHPTHQREFYICDRCIK